jgi:uncharacterized protein YjiS (DUF1127 family)
MRELSPRYSESFSYLPAVVARRASLRSTLQHAAERALDAFFTWQVRSADRLALQTLDDRMLRDIGLTRVDVEVEANKPFWRS